LFAISMEAIAGAEARPIRRNRKIHMNKKANWMYVSFLAGVLAAAGCGGSSSSGAPVPVPAILTVYNANVDFGDVAVGKTSTLSVTLANTGGSPLTVQQNSLSGAVFSTSGVGSGVTLAAGQYTTLAVSFNPSATGMANGAVSLSSSASAAPINMPLLGNGVVVSHWASFDWTPSQSAVVGYNVYLRSPSGQSWIKLNTSPVAASSYTDLGVQGGHTYRYGVTSVSPTNMEIPYSNATEATIPSP
jgi:hypothetical protein